MSDLMIGDYIENIKSALEHKPNDAVFIGVDGVFYKKFKANKFEHEKFYFWDTSQIGKVDKWEWVGDMYLDEIKGLHLISDLEFLVSTIEKIKSISLIANT